MTSDLFATVTGVLHVHAPGRQLMVSPLLAASIALCSVG
jgi:hypothetical protein